MFLRFTAALATFFLTCGLAGLVLAQDCEVGLFRGAGAGSNVVITLPLENFEFYVLIRTENLVKAASYSLEIQNYGGVEAYISQIFPGPEGNGINIRTPNGENVGLGECAIGFGGIPVVVARYVAFLLPVETSAKGPDPLSVITIGANPDENPDQVVYLDCNNQLHTCTGGEPLFVRVGNIATETRTFGQIKALY